MRLSQVLCRQHLDFMFKKHWRIQGKRNPRDTGAEAILKSRGIQITDATNLLKPQRYEKIENLSIVGYKPPDVLNDETHPNWNAKEAYIFSDQNVLLEGLQQAQVITKSIVTNNLPTQLNNAIDNLKIPEIIDKSMQEAVLMSHLLDAEQQKLRKIKDPLRPAFVFPRVLGISDSRKSKLIISKLLTHCERLSSLSTNTNRKIISNAEFIVPLDINGDLVQFELSTDSLIASKNPLSGYNDADDSTKVPNLGPLKATISIPIVNIYTKAHHYPISTKSAFTHPHTIVHSFTPDNVQNLFGTPLTNSQIEGRNLLKAFTVAASRAHQIYGKQIENLDNPIVVQSVQTDGKSFYFGVFELRTLNLRGNDGIKNRWFTIPKINLFDNCSYHSGRPTLDGYNNKVLKLLKIFYSNN